MVFFFQNSRNSRDRGRSQIQIDAEAREKLIRRRDGLIFITVVYLTVRFLPLNRNPGKGNSLKAKAKGENTAGKFI